MPLDVIEGFDDGITTRLGNLLAIPTTEAGRFGGLASRHTHSTTEAPHYTITTARRGVTYVGVALKMVTGTLTTTNNVDYAMVTFPDVDGFWPTWVTIDDTGAVRAYRSTTNMGGSPTLLASSAGGVIAAGAWFYLEVGYLPHDTTGRIVVRINGQAVLDFTGDTRANSATSNVGAVKVGSRYYFGYNRVWLVDDLWVATSAAWDDAEFRGDRRVAGLTLSGTAVAALTGSDGNAVDNHLLVGDGSDLTYVYGAAGTERYSVAALPAGVDAVDAVAVVVRAAKTDSAERTASAVAENGGTVVTAAATGLGVDPASATSFFPTAPDGSAWTPAKVNASTFGVTVA